MANIVLDAAVIGNVKLKNRIIRSATHDGLADEKGAPTPKLISKYVNLAKNDVGCIITGYAALHDNSMSPDSNKIRAAR